jgi:tRNA (guanine-N7-)-methyltransferase
MAHKKLQRFTEIKVFRNVLEFPEKMPGKWNEFFKNDHPVILELACGKGEYTIALANLHPQKNFIGVDIKGNRIWVGAKYAIENKLDNAAFLRTQIEMVDKYFAAREVDEIWITFPDPQLRHSKARKRLTHPRFLRTYKKFLRPGGAIHLKTDSPQLYNFTKMVIDLYELNLISDINDIYNKEIIVEELKIQTYYERLDIAESKKVFYLCFSLTEELMNQKRDSLLKQKISDGNG